jgi:death-on-curing protein
MAHYLTTYDVIAMNNQIMERMGDQSGLRDENALESAVLRPQMSAHYAGASLAAQAATLMAGIALAHPFVDGNKRTALAAGTTFLIANGQWVVCKPTELGQQIEQLITRSSSLDDAIDHFTGWLEEHLQSF